jgi:hypothetical protein
MAKTRAEKRAEADAIVTANISEMVDLAREKFIPFTPTNPYVPPYYKPLRGLVSTRPDAIEIIQAFGLGFEAGCAVKYLLRAGRKPGASEVKDLYKAMEFIQRRINSLNMEGKSDAPK